MHSRLRCTPPSVCGSNLEGVYSLVQRETEQIGKNSSRDLGARAIWLTGKKSQSWPLLLTCNLEDMHYSFWLPLNMFCLQSWRAPLDYSSSAKSPRKGYQHQAIWCFKLIQKVSHLDASKTWSNYFNPVWGRGNKWLCMCTLVFNQGEPKKHSNHISACTVQLSSICCSPSRA